MKGWFKPCVLRQSVSTWASFKHSERLLSLEKIRSFEMLKVALLREHRLTPLAYRVNVYSATRHGGDSYIQYSTRLNCLLKYYLNSREIGEDYQQLASLLVSDRIKEALPAGM